MGHLDTKNPVSKATIGIPETNGLAAMLRRYRSGRFDPMRHHLC